MQYELCRRKWCFVKNVDLCVSVRARPIYQPNKNQPIFVWRQIYLHWVYFSTYWFLSDKKLAKIDDDDDDDDSDRKAENKNCVPNDMG